MNALPWIFLGAGTGVLLGFAGMILAELAEVRDSRFQALRLGVGCFSVPLGVIAGGIWGLVAAHDGTAADLAAAKIVVGRILGGTALVIAVLAVLRIIAERPSSSDSPVNTAAPAPVEGDVDRESQDPGARPTPPKA